MDKWSKELPEDMLNLILNQFPLVELIRAGFVCKSWLSISRKISKRQQLPWLMMVSDPKSKNHKQGARPCFRLSDNTTFSTFSIKLPEIRGKRCCGYFNNSGGWWMTVDEKLGIQLFHPWQGIELQLPRSSSFPHMSIRKAAMSDDGTTVVVIYDALSLAFCKIGDKDKVWTDIKPPPRRIKWGFFDLTFYQDVVYQKGKFYTLGNLGILGVCHIDSATPYAERLTGVVESLNFGCPYMVPDPESKSIFFVYLGLFMDDSYEYGPNDQQEGWRFQVIKIGLEATCRSKTENVIVESLSDRIMFLNQNSSMVVRSSEFPRLEGNCIYFTDERLRIDGHLVLRVYNMGDGTVKQLFHFGASPISVLTVYYSIEDIFKQLFYEGISPFFSPFVWITPPVIE